MKIQNKASYRRPMSKANKRIATAAVAVFLIILVIQFMNWLIEDEGSWQPDYQKVGLSEIVFKEYLTDEDYSTILMQTGLGRDAVDFLLQSEDESKLLNTFERYQDIFFSSGDYECRVIAVIVYEERIRDDDGRLKKGFAIADVRNGDIFITKSTHSLGWRHGHAALVVDKEKGETLEAIHLGEDVILQSVDKWQTYPSFIQLRLKDSDGVFGAEIAEYAKEELLGLPYGLLTGIFKKAPDELKKTQCSHVVWYPYNIFGYDIDSDGSWLVTPKDIANSEYLEIVQIYGVNPAEIWD